MKNKMKLPIRDYWSLLATYLRPQQWYVAALTMLLLTSIGLELLNPQIIRDFIDTATTGGEVGHLIQAAFLFIGIALAQQAAAVAATYLGERVGWTATNTLRGDLAAHALQLDLSFHKSRTPGEIIERIDGDVTALSRFFSQFVVQLLGNLLLLAGVLVLLFREDWRVGLVLSGFVLVAVVVLTRLQQRAIPHWTAVRQMNGEFYGFLGEQLSGIEDVRANGATNYVLHRFQTIIHRWFPYQRRAGIAGHTMWMVSLGLFAIGTATAFGLGAWLYVTGSATIGSVYLIVHYTELLRRPIEQVRNELQELQRAGASIVRVRELLAFRSRLVDGTAILPQGPLDVQFDNVSFGYTDGPATTSDSATIDSTVDSDLVLEAITLNLKAGTTLGLLGRTGSGKTTLARILVRLYDVSDGTLRIGGIDLRETQLADLRAKVGMVTQDVQLFQGTLRDNLTFFNTSVPDERLHTALDQVGLGEWLRGLPHGLESELTGAGGLSAGEAQLFALARVFLKNPGLVIMDEASSRLDPATERRLERAIDTLLNNRTAIIIAHRLATVQRADAILILEQGRVVEYGERTALAADPHSRFSTALRVGLEDVLV
jgi:ABC-type multidrug transport system fused ATPase/permease subunit